MSGKTIIPFCLHGGSNFSWYNAVNWAANSGIMSRYGNGRFSPNDSLTREQLVTLLQRYTARSDIHQEFGDSGSDASRAETAVILYQYMKAHDKDSVATAVADPQ